jgi:N-6 DNA methylase
VAQQLQKARPGRLRLRDQYNQLSLFTDGLVKSAIEQTGVGDDRTDTARREDSQSLAGELSANGERTGDEESPGGGADRGAGTDGRPSLRAGFSAKAGLSGGVGAGGEGVGVAPEREPRAAILAEEVGPEPEPAPARDFRINNAHGIGEGTLREKALANLQAIRALKQIETENRDADETEKARLARYTGWGALANVFKPYPPQEWQAVADQLRELLSDDEYEAARASTPNAHFTSPVVIDAMWQAMQRFGLESGAQILEPSMGIGHFFGLMPTSLLPGSRRTGVELDGITARIAKILYPDVTIFGKGFEETKLPDNYFDAVIGNIPFGNYPVFDPTYRRQPALTRAIHDYFLAKSLDKLRPGGVMALITSRYTMDKQDPGIRRYLSERADLAGALRLPNTAFKANAGTEVTTDILFLQKRAPGTPARDNPWLDLASIETPDGSALINEYFARHPEMMLGTMRLEGSMYKNKEPTLAGDLTPRLLTRGVSSLPGDIFIRSERPRAPPDMAPAAAASIGTVKDGAFAEEGGALVVRVGDRFAPAHLTESGARRVRGMLGVRDAVRVVFQTQLDDASDGGIAQARQRLNEVYDAFVRGFGPLSSRENIKAFAGDPDQPVLLSLENFDPDTGRATKTAIFERRTLERYKPVEHVETAAEALAVSLNETGAIHWQRMEQVTGRTTRQLQYELGSLAYRNPEGSWETADQYLSGDVRAKLAAARAAVGLDASYQRNIEALEAVQPPDLQPGEIEARRGSSWIPATDIRDFVAHLLDEPRTACASPMPRRSRPGPLKLTSQPAGTSATRRRTAPRGSGPPT